MAIPGHGLRKNRVTGKIPYSFFWEQSKIVSYLEKRGIILFPEQRNECVNKSHSLITELGRQKNYDQGSHSFLDPKFKTFSRPFLKTILSFS